MWNPESTDFDGIQDPFLWTLEFGIGNRRGWDLESVGYLDSFTHGDSTDRTS